MKKLILTTLLICLMATASLAGVVTLNNGDKLTGRILKNAGDSVQVETQAMGTVTINKEFVASVVGDQDAEESKAIIKEVKKEESKTKLWKNALSLGYFQQGGNTKKARANMALKMLRKKDLTELTIEAKTFYASENNKMNDQKYFGTARYGFQLEKDSPWYFFGKVEGDHDRFSNIDYRVVPAFGGGYTFVDRDDFKMLTDGALGYQYTKYRDTQKSENELVWIPRFYLEKVLIGKLRLTQEITFYPSLEELETYRLRSETALKQPINEMLTMKLSFEDEYNNAPQGSAKKNDYWVTTAVEVAF